tara:strand:+ start:3868 stop:4479 length:612 start_codon:yes stop_codon:yes gene_type:complete
MEILMEKHLNKDLRQEKKYIFPRKQVNNLERKLISVGFKINHAPNYINNIYFDNYLISAAKESIEGDAVREKYRLRWYNDSNRFVLESKIKLSTSGYKNKKSIKSSILNDAIREAELTTKRRAIIQNSYYRRYYIKKNIRVTLDDQLKFCLPQSNTFKNSKHCVMEVKYKTEFISLFNELNQNVFQLTKFSKYLEGLKHFNII